MPSSFVVAVPVILAHEGWGKYTADPADPGGGTRWGVSTPFFRMILPRLLADGVVLSFALPASVRLLTQEQATEIYQACWWDRFGYVGINDQQAAIKVFDAAVNMGPPTLRDLSVGPAHACAQRAATACGQHVVDSGLLGPADVAAINACDPEGWLRAMRAEMERFYRDLVASHGANPKWLAGWLDRAAWPFSPSSGLA